MGLLSYCELLRAFWRFVWLAMRLVLLFLSRWCAAMWLQPCLPWFRLRRRGVGVVEAAVTVAFTAFGASATAGMAIGLVYRGIVFWMPFLIGAILIQTTKTFRPKRKRRKSFPITTSTVSTVRAGWGDRSHEHKAQRDALRPSARKESNNDEDLQSGKG